MIISNLIEGEGVDSSVFNKFNQLDSKKLLLLFFILVFRKKNKEILKKVFQKFFKRVAIKKAFYPQTISLISLKIREEIVFLPILQHLS